MKFSRQEYWSGLLFPSPEDFPDPGIELVSLTSPALQANSLPLTHLEVQELWDYEKKIIYEKDQGFLNFWTVNHWNEKLVDE